MMPYIPGGDLRRFIKARMAPKGHLTEYESWVITKQLVLAVKTLHERGIVHRDIKPENIMIDEKLNILLSDFGSAIKLESGC